VGPERLAQTSGLPVVVSCSEDKKWEINKNIYKLKLSGRSTQERRLVEVGTNLKIYIRKAL